MPRVISKVIPVTVRRYDKGGDYDDDGLWVEQGFTTLPDQMMSVQPANPDELSDEVRAQHGTEAFKVYADINLFTVDEPGMIRSDQLLIDGIVYQVNQVLRYRMGVRNHTKAIIHRLPDQRSAFGERIDTPPLLDGFEHWVTNPNSPPLTDDFEQWATTPIIPDTPPLTDGFETWA